MILRTVACCAGLVLGLLVSLGIAAPQADAACKGTACRTSHGAGPLDLTKFMGGKKKAATRAATHAVSAHAAKHRQRSKRSTARAPAEPATADTENASSQADAATAFASEPASDVKVVTSDELNDIDRAAVPATVPATIPTTGPALATAPAPAETTGVAAATEPTVQVVNATDFTNIDGKTPETAAPDQPVEENASVNWIQAFWSSWSSWVWSSLRTAFVSARTLFG